MISVRIPAAAQRRAVQAATEVFPTPPLPVYRMVRGLIARSSLIRSLEVERCRDGARGGSGGASEREGYPFVEGGGAAGPVPGVDAQPVTTVRKAAQRQARRQASGQPVVPG